MLFEASTAPFKEALTKKTDAELKGVGQDLNEKMDACESGIHLLF